MEFKKYKEEELNCYLSVIRPPLVETLPDQVLSDGSRNEAGDSGDRLKQYLEKAADLSKGKVLWAMIRVSPESVKQFEHLQPLGISWKYDVVANDTEGMGLDKGFIPVQAPYSPLSGGQNQGTLLIQLPDLNPLLDLQEDLLGDVNSHVAVLALSGNEREAVAQLQQQDAPPQLSSLLGENDLFINITVGKEHGYYDTFLLKAKQDMEGYLKP